MSPSRQAQRSLAGAKPALLAVLGEARRGLNTSLSQLPVRGPEYLAVERLVDALDDVVGILTGNREHFWQRMHHAPSYPYPGHRSTKREGEP